MAHVQTAAGVQMDRRNQSDIWAIFRALRDARSLFGLKPGHVQTLQTLLSFLRPGQGETVFASNVEICRRSGGVDERTLRRHIDRFIEIGLIRRHDSPNRKRYRVRSSDGLALSFGLSLGPLIERGAELIAAAEAQERSRRDQLFLRKQILMRLAQLEAIDPAGTLAEESRKALRRKLTCDEYRQLLDVLTDRARHLSTAVDAPFAEQLSGNDGQIDRHQSISEKEDSEGNDLAAREEAELPALALLTAVCDEATAFTQSPLKSWRDVEAHAQTLAPMMGIPPRRYDEARSQIGGKRTAAAVFILLQMRSRIRNLAAYFHSLTLGRKAESFDPAALLRRLACETI